jgi:NADH-ubiquinone oxidoreductase chain 1
LCGLYAVGQIISYGVRLALIILPFFLACRYNVIYCFKVYLWRFFGVNLVCFLFAREQTPFDFAEGESELVYGEAILR